jgi:hypothetical protein
VKQSIVVISMETNWLTTTLTYRGWGKAEFTDPAGIVEGPAVVHVDRFGEQTITIDAKEFPGGTFTYVKGSVAAANFRRDGMYNPCASVKVTSGDSIFTATERIFYRGGGTIKKPHRLRLRALRSQFERTPTGHADFWVLPLSNFVLPRWPRSPDFMPHPLRIPAATTVSSATPAEGGHARELDRLVIFTVNGEYGFVDQLPEYEKQVERMKKGRIATAINAVMVGPAHIQSVSFADYESLFPVDVLAILTLATGTRVGAPWIEFRDKQCNLIRRIHIQFGSAPFQRGHPALSDLTPDALGELLTCMFSSPERGKGYLRAASNQTIDATLRSQALESRFLSLIRACETLCHYYELDRQNLMTGLTAAQQQTVKGILCTAAAQIRALAHGEADAARSGALDRIASRVQNAGNPDNAFGLAVVELVRRFGLPDADVLQTHLAAHPVAGKSSWPSLLSKLRGAVSHEAYFNLPSGQHNLHEIMTVMDHLNDVLLRIVFKIYGYSGTYQPPIPPLPRLAPVDWVTVDTPPDLIGFT